MDDLISKQAAVLAIRRTAEPLYRGEDNVIPAEYEDAIMELPPIDPVKHGKWITAEYGDGTVRTECSVCGYGRGLPPVRNYCPNCGARMDGGEG